MVVLALWMAVAVRMSCCYSVLKKIVVDQVWHMEFKTQKQAQDWCARFHGAQEACFLFEERQQPRTSQGEGVLAGARSTLDRGGKI